MRFQHKIGLTAGAVLAALCCEVPAKADEADGRLLKAVAAKYRSMKTLSATLVTEDPEKPGSYHAVAKIKLKRPGFLHSTNAFSHPANDDGKTSAKPRTQTGEADIYTNAAALTHPEVAAEMFNLIYPDFILAVLFFAPDHFFAQSMSGKRYSTYGQQTTLTYFDRGREAWRGASYRVLEIDVRIEDKKANPKLTLRKIDLYIGVDGLAHRLLMFNPRLSDGHKHKRAETQIATEINPLITDSELNAPGSSPASFDKR